MQRASWLVLILAAAFAACTASSAGISGAGGGGGGDDADVDVPSDTGAGDIGTLDTSGGPPDVDETDTADDVPATSDTSDTGTDDGGDDTGASDSGADTSDAGDGGDDAADTGSGDIGEGDVGEDGGSDAGDAGDTGDTGDTSDGGDTGGPIPCTADDDCEDPLVCVFDTTDGVLTQTCDDPVGPGDPGTGCSDDADCANGLCVDGVCVSPCEDSVDCGGLVCEPVDVPVGGGTDVVDGCVPPPTPCQAAADCADPEICVVDRTGAAVELTCGDPIGGGGHDDTCTRDVDCATGLCIGGSCQEPCTMAGDCIAAGEWICTTTDVPVGAGGTDAVDLCAPRPPELCTSDADCTDAGDRCVADTTPTTITFACDPPNPGGGETGDPCADDLACAQNLCLDGTCAGPCASGVDCAIAEDFECATVEVVLDAGSDDATVCVPPTPCLSRDDCAGGRECYVEREPSALSLLCAPGNAGGRADGQGCADDGQCFANLCFEDRFTEHCAAPCDDPTDCSAGQVCATVDVPASDGVPVAASLCVDPPAAPCTTNAACGVGNSCAVVPDTDGAALELVCAPTDGGLPNGTPCGEHADCASRVCLNGSCAAPCETTDDCNFNQLCRPHDVDTEGLSGNFDLCETLPEQACDSTRDCTDGVRVCSEIRGASGAFCRFPNEGEDPLGTTCSTSGDCFEAFCLSLGDECSVVCEDSALDCGPGQICTELNFGGTDLGVCNRSCTDNTACQSVNPNNYCTINGNSRTNAIDQICVSQEGPNTLGEICTTGSDCDSGLCLNTFLFDGTTCTTAADCDPGETCDCPPDQPGCVTGRQCAVQTRACTWICDDPGDCVSGVAGNQLTDCGNNTFVGLPDGSGVTRISTCAQP